MSVAKVVHASVTLCGTDERVGRVEMEDCLLETMTGCAIFSVSPAALVLYPACSFSLTAKRSQQHLDDNALLSSRKLVAYTAACMPAPSLFSQAKVRGEAILTRCTLRKHAGRPASVMEPERTGVVLLHGAVKVTLQRCYLEVGIGFSLAHNVMESTLMDSILASHVQDHGSLSKPW
jgi:hypothetical protein